MRVFIALFASAQLAACHAHGDRDSTRTASTSVSASASAVAQASLGCHVNSECSGREFCEFSPGLCGKGQAPGHCRAKPTSCESGREPVCACSGKVYESACTARAAGEDLDVMGRCTQELPGFAECGAHYCDARHSYCEIYLSDVFDLPTDHFCRPLPEACKPKLGAKTPGCACFPKDTACLGFCGPLPAGGVQAFHLTCQGKYPPPDRFSVK